MVECKRSAKKRRLYKMSKEIRLQRDILNWKWWSKPEMLSLLIYLIAMAQEKGVRRKHRLIKRGQLLITRQELVEAIPNLTPQKARSCLERLERDGEIKLEAAKGFTIVTVCRYEEYCPMEGEVKTREELKEETEKRKKEFYDSLVPFLEKYSKGMLREFFDYWSEMNKSCSKMRFEMQPTWDLARRLGTWDRNNSKYTKEDGKTERERKSASKLQAILESNES